MVPKSGRSYRFPSSAVFRVPGDIGDVVFYSDDQIHIVSSDIKTRFDVGNSMVTTNYLVHVWFFVGAGDSNCVVARNAEACFDSV